MVDQQILLKNKNIMELRNDQMIGLIPISQIGKNLFHQMVMNQNVKL